MVKQTTNPHIFERTVNTLFKRLLQRCLIIPIQALVLVPYIIIIDKIDPQGMGVKAWMIHILSWLSFQPGTTTFDEVSIGVAVLTVVGIVSFISEMYRWTTHQQNKPLSTTRGVVIRAIIGCVGFLLLSALTAAQGGGVEQVVVPLLLTLVAPVYFVVEWGVEEMFRMIERFTSLQSK